MKSVKFGDILTVNYGIIVHGCNAQRVMGSGLAKSIREKWPACFEHYRNELSNYTNGQAALGTMSVFEAGSLEKPLYIVNGITQEYYGRDIKRYVSYEAVHKVFLLVAEFASIINLPVHYPMIGAGLGGGDWAVISEIIDSAFEQWQTVDHFLWIYD